MSFRKGELTLVQLCKCWGVAMTQGGLGGGVKTSVSKETGRSYMDRLRKNTVGGGQYNISLLKRVLSP